MFWVKRSSNDHNKYKFILSRLIYQSYQDIFQDNNLVFFEQEALWR